MAGAETRKGLDTVLREWPVLSQRTPRPIGQGTGFRLGHMQMSKDNKAFATPVSPRGVQSGAIPNE